jgi:hypothetical protein
MRRRNVRYSAEVGEVAISGPVATVAVSGSSQLGPAPMGLAAFPAVQRYEVASGRVAVGDPM